MDTRKYMKENPIDITTNDAESRAPVDMDVSGPSTSTRSTCADQMSSCSICQVARLCAHALRRVRRRKPRSLVRWVCSLVVTAAVLLFVKHVLFERKDATGRDVFSADDVYELFPSPSSDNRRFAAALGSKMRPSSCEMPELELWSAPMRKLFSRPVEPINCGNSPDWVLLTENGTVLRLRDDLPNARCQVFALLRINDDKFAWKRVGRLDGSTTSGNRITMTSDFARVVCNDVSTKNSFSTIVAGLRKLPPSVEGMTTRPGGGRRPLDIIMFGFDSMSRLSWRRNLPKTYELIVGLLGMHVMRGYNIVGDGTPQALLPILTGKTEEELPEARRGFKGAVTVDGHPWLWKNLSQMGYRTQWGEDGANVGTFNYRMLGFKSQPTDHYMRPFQKIIYSYTATSRPYCLMGQPRHKVMFDWQENFLKRYSRESKFSFLFHSEMSHETASKVKVVDSDLRDYLQRLLDGKYLENALLVLMSDHGARFTSLRTSAQGKLEERLTMMALRLPEWLRRDHPDLEENLRQNSARLSTPFDVHETFRHVLNVEGSRAPLNPLGERGLSLLRPIPLDRTCHHAHIAAHWCACLSWHDVSNSTGLVVEAAQFFVRRINELIAPFSRLCTPVSLQQVRRALMSRPNSKLLRYRGSADKHGRVADFSDVTSPDRLTLQLDVSTKPLSARYEVTVVVERNDRRFRIHDGDISRTNKYGPAPNCIASLAPHLRPYCVCPDQLASVTNVANVARS